MPVRRRVGFCLIITLSPIPCYDGYDVRCFQDENGYDLVKQGFGNQFCLVAGKISEKDIHLTGTLHQAPRRRNTYFSRLSVGEKGHFRDPLSISPFIHPLEVWLVTPSSLTSMMLHKPSISFPSRGYGYVRCPLRYYPMPRPGNRIAMLATEATRGARKGGTIADVFTTLGPNADVAPLPARFSTVKKDVLRDMGVAPDMLELAWKGVLKALEPRVQEIISKRGDVSLFPASRDFCWHTQSFVEIIPRISYGEIEAGLSESQRDAIRKTGVVVITGGVPKEVSTRGRCAIFNATDAFGQLKEALNWKRHIKDYIAANPVKGVTLLRASTHSTQRIDWQVSPQRIYKHTNCTIRNHSSMPVRTLPCLIPKRLFYPFGTPLRPFPLPSISQHPLVTLTASAYVLPEIARSHLVHTSMEGASSAGKIQHLEEYGPRFSVAQSAAGRHSIRLTQLGE